MLNRSVLQVYSELEGVVDKLAKEVQKGTLPRKTFPKPQPISNNQVINNSSPNSTLWVTQRPLLQNRFTNLPLIQNTTNAKTFVCSEDAGNKFLLAITITLWAYIYRGPFILLIN